jgi:hypothetical protein
VKPHSKALRWHSSELGRCSQPFAGRAKGPPVLVDCYRMVIQNIESNESHKEKWAIELEKHAQKLTRKCFPTSGRVDWKRLARRPNPCIGSGYKSLKAPPPFLLLSPQNLNREQVSHTKHTESSSQKQYTGFSKTKISITPSAMGKAEPVPSASSLSPC